MNFFLRHLDRTICRLILFGFLLVLLFAADAYAQNAENIPRCQKSDLDIQFAFFSSPVDYGNLKISGVNTSGHPCNFDRAIFWPSLNFNNPDALRQSTQKTIPLPECNDCKLGRVSQFDFSGNLYPGETVTETFRWKIKPPEENIECVHPDWISTESSLLVTPSLFPTVCSDIEIQSIGLIPANNNQDQNPGPGATMTNPAFLISSSKTTYNDRESFELHLSTNNLASQTTADAEACPVLFIRQQSPDGQTRLDVVPYPRFKGCGSTRMSDVGDWQSGFSVDSGATSRWAGPGDHLLQVFRRVAPLDDTQVHLEASNVLHIHIAKPEEMQRNWTRLNGVAANITLDKDTYALGEDIPLHMAVANFEAEAPLFSWDPIWDPCEAINVSILDANGVALPKKDLFDYLHACFGHGFGPMPFEKGKIVPIEWNLKTLGLLPNHPGTYTVVLTWCTTTGSREDNSTGWKTNLKPYATVEAKAVIHINAPAASSTN